MMLPNSFAVVGFSFLVLVAGALPVGAQTNAGADPGSSQAPAASAPAVDTSVETKAFEAAKELGTIEAWNAFIKNYPHGFQADLARAYAKKLQGAGAAPATGAPSAAATDVMSVTQVDYDGGSFVKTGSQSWVEQRQEMVDLIRYKEVGRTAAGIDLLASTDNVTITLDVANKIILRRLGSSQPVKFRDITSANSNPVMAEPVPVASPPSRAAAPTAKAYAPKPAKTYQPLAKPVVKKPTKSCNSNQTLKNGKCVWKTNKNGFEIAPWKKPGCNTWQAQCSQGNASACNKYEATCQVN